MAVRKGYKGAAPATTLASGINNSVLSITLTSGTGYPDGAVGPFFIVIDRGLSTEEKVYCDSRSGDAITVNASGRGADDTVAASHSAGAVVEHVFTAEDADEANKHITDTNDDDHTQYLNTTRHDALSHDTSVIADDSVTGDKIEVSQRWEPGDLKWSARSTPTTGWLVCDGAAVSRTTYADLFAAISTTYGVGDGATTFNVPDFRDKMVTVEGTVRTRGATGGSKDAVAVSHNHTQDAHGHGGSSGNQSASHAHSGTSSSNGSHAHNIIDMKTTSDTNHMHIADQNPAFVASDPSPISGDTFDATTDSEAAHTHTLTTGNQSANHSHTVTVNNQTATNQTAGVAGTDANLPPYGVANCFIKT